MSDLITRRAGSVPVETLAAMSLRYEQVRRMSDSAKFAALVRTVIAEHSPGDGYNKAFDKLVDKAVLSQANSEARA